jgi:hypothetical protein
MNVIKVEVSVRVPDGSTLTGEKVKDAVETALAHNEEYDDQSLWNWHLYDVEVKD